MRGFVAKELYTGVLLRDDAIEWTTVCVSKGRAEVAGSGLIPVEQAAAADALPEEKPAKRNGPAAGAIKGRVSICLDSSRVLLRVLNFPPASEEDIPQMARLQADRFCPFPIESAVVSHEIAERRENGLLALLAAAKREAAEEAERDHESHGLIADRVDVDLLGRWRVLRDSELVSGARGRHVILFWDTPDGAMIVAENGSPALFQNLGLPPDMEEEQLAMELLDEVRHAIVSLDLEYGSAEPARITLLHGERPLAGVARSLADALDCEVDTAPLESLPSVSEGVARRAAEGGVIDLTPKEWKARAGARVFRKRLIAAAAAALGIWAAAIGSVFGGVLYQQTRLERLEAERDRIAAEAMEVRRIRRRVVSIEQYMDPSRSAIEHLREISSIQPDGVELTSFIYRKDESIRLSGEADSVDAVYEFKRNVDESPMFLDSRLSGPRHDRRKNKDIFDLAIEMKGGAE